MSNKMSNIEKAYIRGHKMGEYVINYEGIDRAIKRGSLANIFYRMASMVKAYDDGYEAAIAERKLAHHAITGEWIGEEDE